MAFQMTSSAQPDSRWSTSAGSEPHHPCGHFRILDDRRNAASADCRSFPIRIAPHATSGVVRCNPSGATSTSPVQVPSSSTRGVSRHCAVAERILSAQQLPICRVLLFRQTPSPLPVRPSRWSKGGAVPAGKTRGWWLPVEPQTISAAWQRAAGWPQCPSLPRPGCTAARSRPQAPGIDGRLSSSPVACRWRAEDPLVERRPLGRPGTSRRTARYRSSLPVSVRPRHIS